MKNLKYENTHKQINYNITIWLHQIFFVRSQNKHRKYPWTEDPWTNSSIRLWRKNGTLHSSKCIELSKDYWYADRHTETTERYCGVGEFRRREDCIRLRTTSKGYVTRNSHWLVKNTCLGTNSCNRSTEQALQRGGTNTIVHIILKELENHEKGGKQTWRDESITIQEMPL